LAITITLRVNAYSIGEAKDKPRISSLEGDEKLG
jgi:hypothetical protein